MIPILFAANETAFTSNGIGRLSDATLCEVTEERNGQYELRMEYPVGGQHAADIAVGCYIYATHDESKTPEAFQIYEVTEPLQGVLEISAWHISYLLNSIIVTPYTAANCSDALAGISANSINTNPFTFWTDKAVTGDFNLRVPRSARAILGGTEGSILDRYGTGEFEFIGYTVKLYLHRGTNRDVSIRYGKNLQSLDRTLNSADTYNSVVPYWTDDTTSIYSPTLVTRTGETARRAIALDLSDEFEEQPTVSELQDAAQTYIDASTAPEIKDNIKINFVQLWQTTEYANFAALQRIYLCDTVNVFYAKLGINATAKCIKTVYDTLRERYTEMELGEPQVSLSQQIQADVSDAILPQVPSKSMLISTVDRATELITGGYGGYIKYNYLSDGTPSEILVMDTDDAATAVHVIRINQNGIGFSSTGVGGPYTSAWTIDGAFVADFITTGNLNANLITTGTLDADRIAAGSLTIGQMDAAGQAAIAQGQEGYILANGNTGRLDDLEGYIHIANGKMTLGQNGSDFTATLDNTRLAFQQAGEDVAYISNSKLYITETEVLNSMRLGNYQWIIDPNTGRMSLKWVE